MPEQPPQPNQPNAMKQPNPSRGPVDPSRSDADGPLIDRLDAYLTGLDREPVPPRLTHTSLADVRAAHQGASFAWNGRGGALAGAMATLVLLLAVFAVSRQGDDGAVVASNPGGGTTAPIGGGKIAPLSTSTTQGDHGKVGGITPGTVDPGATTTSTSTSVDPGASSTITTNAAPTTTTKPAVTTSSTAKPPTTTTPTTTKPPSTTTTTTVHQPGPGELFYDNFSTGSDGWNIDSGSMAVWNTADGFYLGNTSPLGLEGRASAGSTGWINDTVTAVIKAEPNAKVAGLATRYQDKNNYVFCKMDLQGDHLWLGVFENGSAQLLANPSYNFSSGVKYTMTLSASGSSFGCSVAGATSANGSDSSFSSGRIAVLADGGVGFTNVTVTTP